MLPVNPRRCGTTMTHSNSMRLELAIRITDSRELMALRSDTGYQNPWSFLVNSYQGSFMLRGERIETGENERLERALRT